MRRIVAFGFALVVVPLTLGAGSITLIVTPNPGGSSGILKGHGTWSVGAGESFVLIEFQTQLEDSDPPQYTYKKASVDGADWEANLKLAAAKYKPTVATLTFLDAAKKTQLKFVTNNITQEVK